MDNVPTTGLTGRVILHAKTLGEVSVFDGEDRTCKPPAGPDAPAPETCTRALEPRLSLRGASGLDGPPRSIYIGGHLPG